MSLDSLEDADIEEGVFKYVLLVATNKEGHSKHLVRGFRWANYHDDIVQAVRSQCKPLGVRVECIGGGRIRHEPEQRSILVYGYSQGYGQPDHQISVDILKRKFPYEDITYSNDGY